ncbi:MAG TPA: FKBP-type peptidyl-prolyl cis-trans isomerase [Mucilaginibacter sp.]
MKKYFLILLLLIVGFSACQKIQTTTQAQKQVVIDDQKIQDYIKANNITATKDPATGVYYKVINEGNPIDANGDQAKKPTALSTVQVTYTYGYLNGLSIGETTRLKARVSSFIAGLQVGIPKLYTGGRILLIIPSGQAYGAGEVNGIPRNSVLVYTLDLDGVTAN